jgi:heme/copper-type cytochrome/quinol oxidase subunit 1
MHTVLLVLTGILLLATLGVLFAGLLGMVREQDPARSNRLMRWRVIFQAGAVILLVIMMSLLRS